MFAFCIGRLCVPSLDGILVDADDAFVIFLCFVSSKLEKWDADSAPLPRYVPLHKYTCGI